MFTYRENLLLWPVDWFLHQLNQAFQGPEFPFKPHIPMPEDMNLICFGSRIAYFIMKIWVRFSVFGHPVRTCSKSGCLCELYLVIDQLAGGDVCLCLHHTHHLPTFLPTPCVGVWHYSSNTSPLGEKWPGLHSPHCDWDFRYLWLCGCQAVWQGSTFYWAYYSLWFTLGFSVQAPNHINVDALEFCEHYILSIILFLAWFVDYHTAHLN